MISPGARRQGARNQPAASSRRIFDAAGDLIDVFFIGNDLGRSTDVQEVAEALCKQLDSRVLLIGAGQTALAGNLPLLQRLIGRFTIPVELSDSDDKIVGEVEWTAERQGGQWKLKDAPLP